MLADILDTCGDNIDAAIKKLGQLELTARCVGEVQKGIPESAKASQESKEGPDTAGDVRKTVSFM